MVTSLPVALLVGLLLGFMSGLGVGGGSLLVLWLTLILQESAQDARAINLLFFIVCAGSVSLLRLEKGILSVKKLMPTVLVGIGFAIIGSLLQNILSLTLLEKLFGFLLLFAGIRELFYRPRKAK